MMTGHARHPARALDWHGHCLRGRSPSDCLSILDRAECFKNTLQFPRQLRTSDQRQRNVAHRSPSLCARLCLRPPSNAMPGCRECPALAFLTAAPSNNRGMVSAGIVTTRAAAQWGHEVSPPPLIRITSGSTVNRSVVTCTTLCARAWPIVPLVLGALCEPYPLSCAMRLHQCVRSHAVIRPSLTHHLSHPLLPRSPFLRSQARLPPGCPAVNPLPTRPAA